MTVDGRPTSVIGHRSSVISRRSSVISRRSSVVIVGAGPAGMSAALFLAKKGIASTLIEKEVFPRNKICGDGLSGWVVSMLRRIDPGLLKKLQELPEQLPSSGVRFFAPNMKNLALPYFSAKYPDDPPGHVIRRIDFDRLLAEEVKGKELIELIEGVEVGSVDIHETGVILTDSTGTLKFEAEMVIGACGAASRLFRELAPRKNDNRNHATGIRQYYEGVTGVHPGNFVDFYFLEKFLPGYLWVFPLPNGKANVGAGIRTDILKKKRISLKQVMEEAIAVNPHLAERFANAKPISGISAWDLPLGSKKVALSGNRFLLAGDAASLVDPFTGEGVGNAMWSGFAAAEHIEKALASGQFDQKFNSRYDRFVYKKLWSEMKLSTTIQNLINKPWLFKLVMNHAAGNEFLKQSVTRMIDDLEERKKLRRPWWYVRVLIGR